MKLKIYININTLNIFSGKICYILVGSLKEACQKLVILLEKWLKQSSLKCHNFGINVRLYIFQDSLRWRKARFF